jgi:hypothetical protein
MATGEQTTLAQRRAIRDEALERLNQLTTLEPSWDSEDGLPPTACAITKATWLLTEIAEDFGSTVGAAVRPYAVAPLGDGGVQLEWRGSSCDIEVEVGSTGELAYLFIERHGAQRQFSEADGVADREIIDLISRVFPAPRDG